MASMAKSFKKAFIKYTKKHYPDEAGSIISKADELFPVLFAKAPDIGGKENLMAHNLDLMILAISFYEASDQRVDGKAFEEISRELYNKYKFVRKLININRKWQMKVLRKSMYKRYIPYSKLVEEKTANGEWNNTWRVRINPTGTDEGVRFDLVGCPLADYARANGYMDLLPSRCAADHILPALFHAKLIRTHTCALGSDSCDYWYVADESETAKNFKGTLV
jgi:hypothetical protein